jgi:hypothetical protein
MADPSVLGNVIQFFQRIGIYDVVLPFLLTFTIVFAIFEKSKILGMERTKEGEYTKKNLNSMAAFVIAFMVIASSRLVETITSISANIVVLLLLGTFFLLLVGTFYAPKEKEPIALDGGWKTTFTVIMFIGIVVVFLDAIKTEAGVSWLDQLFNYLGQFWTSTAVAAIILIIFLVVFVAVMVREPATGGSGGSSKDK